MGEPAAKHKPSWGIVATVDEPAPLILAFVAWHLAQGAAEIHLFLDRPNPQAEAVLDGLPGVILTRTDDAYWQDVLGKPRPARHTRRQLINVRRAYRAAKVDWLLHCDGDEFVADIPALQRTLAAAGDDILFVQLGVLERVLETEPAQPLSAPATPASIFDGIYRTGHGDFDLWGPAVYGRFTKFLQRGLSGHAAGKAVVRTGRDAEMGVHFPEGLGKAGKDGEDVVLRVPRQLYHFDGLTRLHFFLKLVRRLYYPPIKGNRNPHGIGRGQQIRYAGNKKADIGEMERLYIGTRTLTPEQIEALEAMGCLVRAPFDPRPQLAALGIDVDLTPEAFDAVLRDREAALIAKSELPL